MPPADKSSSSARDALVAEYGGVRADVASLKSTVERLVTLSERAAEDRGRMETLLTTHAKTTEKAIETVSRRLDTQDTALGTIQDTVAQAKGAAMASKAWAAGVGAVAGIAGGLGLTIFKGHT
jgi:hypothetical protein